MIFNKRNVFISDPLKEIILQPDRKEEGLAYQVIILHDDDTFTIEVR